MSQLNFYELLNAPTTATFEELKRNYKQLILQCHPDKLQQQQQQQQQHQQSSITVNAIESSNPIGESDSNFNAINEAWNTLKDPIKRKHYDAELLQTKFQTHNNIYASITVNDMQRTRVEMVVDEEEGESANEEGQKERTDTDKETTSESEWSFAYAYECRCGGQFLLDDESAETQREQQQQQQLTDRESEMIVECSECSLVIIVKPVAVTVNAR